MMSLTFYEYLAEKLLPYVDAYYFPKGVNDVKEFIEHEEAVYNSMDDD